MKNNMVKENLGPSNSNDRPDLPDFFAESTLKRQIAYNQAIERIRADIKKKARPLPVLFDEDGKWAF